MYSFMRNLRLYLDEIGVEHTADIEGNYDLLVANSWMLTSWELYAAKRRLSRLKVLHRIDGAAQDYGRDGVGDLYQKLAIRLADVTVFQSNYGRYATREKFGVIEQDGPTIYNPVDIKRFHPDGPRVELAGKIRIAFVTYSKNPKKGAAEAFRLIHEHRSVQFILIGRYEDPPLVPNVTLVGHVDWAVLPDYLRSCDFFLMLSENETCPNVVLEAMASGLPVLYKDSGGTGELVREAGFSVTPSNFRETLDRAWPLREELGRRARELCETEFSSAVVVTRYLEAARQADRRSPPSRLTNLWYRLRTRLSI